MIEYIIYGFFGLLFLFFIAGIRIIRPIEVGLIETFGRFTRLGRPGFNWLIPLVQRLIRVNLTENMVDIPPQKIITKDDLNADVDAVVYFKVLNPKKAIYAVQNYRKQISSLSRTTLRDIIGKMTLSEANSRRNQINKVLETELDRQTESWGIDIVRVEIQRIEPPQDVQESMNKVVKAEREKIAATDLATARETEADGIKRAEIKKAEGIKESLILQAIGEAKAKVTIAKAEAEKIKVVNDSIRKHFKDEAQTYKKLQTFENAFEKGTKFVVDPKSNMVNVMSDMAGVMPIPKKS